MKFNNTLILQSFLKLIHTVNERDPFKMMVYNLVNVVHVTYVWCHSTFIDKGSMTAKQLNSIIQIFKAAISIKFKGTWKWYMVVENLSICFCSYKTITLKISNFESLEFSGYSPMKFVTVLSSIASVYFYCFCMFINTHFTYLKCA